MNTIPLGVSTLRTSRLAYGCWRLAGTWEAAKVTSAGEAQGIQAVQTAFEVGFRLFDTADIYCQGVAETLLGRALRQVPGMRSQIVIATKCGIRFAGDPTPSAPARYDFSAAHILRSCDQSLKRLGLDTIDLYQLHRPDFLGDPEEIAGAFAQLKAAGKVREFGVSNFRPSQVAVLQKACPMRLIVHQVEMSLARLDCFMDGTLDQCLMEKMTPLAWSPLAGGFLGAGLKAGVHDPRRARLIPLTQSLETMAKAHNTTPSVIALAWLLKHPSKIVPIIGSTNPERIREAVQADTLELSREEWYQLLIAARGEALP